MKACVPAALCSLLILSSVVGSVRSASCCVNYFKKEIPCKRLLNYSIQTINGLCDINAIIFHMRRKFLCADPLSKSTQRGMKCIDERKRLEAQIISNEMNVNNGTNEHFSKSG